MPIPQRINIFFSPSRLDNFIGFTHVNVDFPGINASRNVNVDISSAALDDKPPPTGTLVIITALNPGTSAIPEL